MSHVETRHPTWHPTNIPAYAPECDLLYESTAEPWSVSALAGRHLVWEASSTWWQATRP